MNVHSSRNTAVGSNSLESHNLDSAGNGYNTAVGYNSGLAITTGTKNTIIGGLAGDALTTGVQNVVVGYNALSTEDAHSDTMQVI